MDPLTEILRICNEDPTEFTYLGIGSCPHAESISKIDDHWDQILPLFLRDVFTTNKTVRAVHIDPAFSDKWSFMKAYFEEKMPGSICEEISEKLYRWHTSQADILLAASWIDHEKDYPFLKKLTETHITYRAECIVQEYSGCELGPVFKKLFSETSDQDAFKELILFDITYGVDCHCMTNMVKYNKLLYSKGHLINFTLYTREERLALITRGISPALQDILRRHFTTEYKEVLNRLHVDYRRRLRNESSLWNNADDTTDGMTAEAIMDRLQVRLTDIIGVLHILGTTSVEKVGELKELFVHHRKIDVYDWYDRANKIVA
jgi:hypothetical protein